MTTTPRIVQVSVALLRARAWCFQNASQHDLEEFFHGAVDQA
jgi:hypothetical protein